MSQKAVIFAAGEGTRLRPLTLLQPKAMVPIAGRAIVDYILMWLHEQGVRSVGINLHYRAAAITDHLGTGDAFGVRLHYSNEDELLGSAGALRPLRPFLEEPHQPFIAVYGDTLSTLDLAPLLGWHAQSNALLTMAVMDHPNPMEAGIVELSDARSWHGGIAGRITRILEKPLPHEVFSRVANAGVFVIDPGVIGYVPGNRPSDIARDLIPALLRNGAIVSGWQIPSDAVVLDIGTLPSLERAEGTWPAVWEARRRPPD